MSGFWRYFGGSGSAKKVPNSVAAGGRDGSPSPVESKIGGVRSVSLPAKWSPGLIPREQLVQLFETCRNINKTIHPKETMRAIIWECLKILHCEKSILFVYDKETQMLRSVEKGNIWSSITPGKGIPGEVFETQSLMRMCDKSTGSHFGSMVEESGWGSLNVKSVLASSVFDEDGTVIGVLVALNKLVGGLVQDSASNEQPPAVGLGEGETIGSFTDEDEAIMAHLSLLAGGAMRKSAIHTEAITSRDRADGLLNLMQSLRNDLGIQSALLTLASYAKQLVRAEHCMVFLVDSVHSSLWSLATDTGEEIRISLNKGTAGLCASSGKVVICEDPATDCRFVNLYLHDGRKKEEVRNVLCVPILDEQEHVVIGVVQLLNKTDDDGEVLRFTDEDVRILEVFGRVVGPRLRASEFGMCAAREISTEAGLAFSKSPKEQRKRQGLRGSISEQDIILEGETEDEEATS